MKEINIGKVILQKRRDKGLTQDDLASFIGVSKASVSKWEIGQSYPDITLLPQLAAFFNISLDELMGYQPQMNKEEIRKIYISLSSDFANKPFGEVLESCHGLAKKYFSCFPLLFQLGLLLINNSSQAPDMEQTMIVIGKAKELFLRIRKESNDPELCRLAQNMEAFCALTQGNANEVIEILDGVSNKIISVEPLLSPAYQMIGDFPKAKSVLQAGIYQHMGALFGDLTDYLLLCSDSPQQFEDTCKRALAIIEAFDLKHLHPALLVKFYLLMAQGYLMIGNTGKALETLEEYTRIVTSDIYPLKIKGDDYFDLLEEWIEELDLGATLPRDERIVRQSMVDSVLQNPAFISLSKEHRFQRIAEKLNHNLLGGAL